MSMYLMSIYFMGRCLTSVHLKGVLRISHEELRIRFIGASHGLRLAGICLMGLYLMGVHLMGVYGVPHGHESHKRGSRVRLIGIRLIKYYNEYPKPSPRTERSCFTQSYLHTYLRLLVVAGISHFGAEYALGPMSGSPTADTRP